MRVPQQYTAKVEKIKNVILSRSGLISEYGVNNIKFEVDEFYEFDNGDVSEIVFSLRLNDVVCDECDFEPQLISETILEIKNKLENACSFYISPKLELKSNQSSLRGVLFYDCKIWRSEFEYLTFGIFYDVGEEF
jgi:hypothetical protein